MATLHRQQVLLSFLLFFLVAAPDTALAQAKAPPSWEQIEQLANDQQLAAALEGVEARLAQAREKADENEWARALVRTVQLRTGLHGYDTAVRFLRDQPWPKGLLPRTAVQLYYAQTLVSYTEAYGWEIRQRERVVSSGPVDLKSWSFDQIIGEANRTYAEVWKARDQLGATQVQSFSTFLLPNTYPAGIRSTLRDAVTYLWAAILADSSVWSPEQSQGLYQLDLRVLLEGTPRVDLGDPAVHPLMKIATILGDLEAWHRGAARREAELEARLTRVSYLHGAFSQADDRTRIRQHLAAFLEGFRKVPWWAMGQGLLAELERQVDHRVRAHRLAEAGASAYPQTLGGQRCASILSELDSADFSLTGMTSDGPQRRSIELTHRNLPILYFRAYPYDLEKLVTQGTGMDLMPDSKLLLEAIQKQKPAASWSVALPATTDFRDHRTFITPPLLQRGTYFIAASVREDFSSKDNDVRGVLMTVTPYTLTTSEQGRRVEVRVVQGETGLPVGGVEVRLFLQNYEGRRRREVQRVQTNAQGEAVFTQTMGEQYETFLVMAGRGRDALVQFDHVVFYERDDEPPNTQVLIFTDRSVYRPLQKLLWKVVAYQGNSEQTRFKVQPNASVTVSLRDPNGEAVEQRVVRTNSFGSASGEFTIPAGRVLGAWSVSTEPWSNAQVRVEEYKRPTFEVTLKDADSAVRLNRPATFRGEARYYFGLPVVNGSVRWRAYREPIIPYYLWGGGSYRGRISMVGSQIVASGTSALKEDGSFQITFTPEADEREAKSLPITWRYRVEADATDEGGETRSASRSFRLGFVSVEAQIEADVNFFVEGEPAEVRVTRSNLDGVPQPGKGSWQIVALQQPAQPLLPAEEPVDPSLEPQPEGAEERITTPGDLLRRRWEWNFAPASTLHRWAAGAEQAKGSAEHDAQGLARLKLPNLQAGAYRLQYETVDAFGQKFTTSQDFVVAGTNAPVALPAMLQLERGTVRVGEKARVLAFSGFQGQPLLLDVYQGDKRIQRRQLTGMKAPAVIEIPVTEALRGGFSVSLVGVRDYQLMHFAESVIVPFDDKELTLEFSTFRDLLRPGAKETWRVTVRGPKGAKVEAGTAELLAYMYDQSLDLFAPHRPPSVSDLYRQRDSGVGMNSSLSAADAHWITVSGNLGRGKGWSRPDEDRLISVDNYGVGGPGSRRGLEMKRREIIQIIKGSPSASRDSTVTASPAPPPPPPAPMSAEKSNDARTQAGILASVSGGGAPNAPQEPLRSNFAETAFWIPQLLTGPDGSATLEFTVPDSVTAWSAWVHAITRDFKGGSVQRTTRSVKELMVRPYVPRFLREGDKAVLEVVINNASQQKQQGTLTLDIVDPETEKSVLSRFGVTSANQPFTVEPGKGTSLRFTLAAPAQVGTVAFKVSARAGNLGDGEQRPLPVLPGRMHLSQSRFVTLHDKDRKELTFEDLRRNDDPSRINEQLVVTVDAQLFYSVLQALPYLVEYPYECTEQTLNRFVSSGIVSSLYGQYPAVAKMAKQMSERPTRFETWDAVDANRKMTLEETPWLQEARGGPETDLRMLKVLDPAVASAERASALAKLQKAQTASGGFPWWPGGPPSPYMTLYIVHGLARASEYKVGFSPDMTQRAWGYLTQVFRDEYATKLMKEELGWEFLTFLNYVASSYPDPTYTGNALTPDERKRILDFSFKHWKDHSPYLKGYLALTLKRAGREKDADLVWASVMDSAKTSPELGTYWAPEDRSWLWYNDTTETHAFALRTLTELKPKDSRRDGLVQWLLLDKKLNHWKSTRATAEALYALVKYLEQEGALGIREDAKVTVGDKTVEFAFEPDKYTGKKNQVVIPGPEVDPVKSSKVVVEKTAKGFAFASATWQFSTEKLPTEDRGDFFQVSRRYFVRVSEGRESTLRPLAEGAKLAPGDEVEVQISLRSKHEAEYVHLRDPRAAGLEPENAVSRHKWDLGIVWYEETRDSGTNFFFERLPAGEYTFKYRLRANMAGTFRVGPATVQSMYAPEFTAYSTGAMLTVGSARP
ncbi:alpha-2-macroglobulin family protein [Hyalangium versicolor]|uniref:alpha-2-macroglobulin family protein n=1 Tax=Hyalangium versicolor TaxID=2861190 RepID=UPI001CC9459C|nr:alpha-2-macroglobulin family protein [Hyalangium versicolor]